MNLKVQHAAGYYNIKINSDTMFRYLINKKKIKPEVFIIVDSNVYNLYWKKISPWIRKQFVLKGIFKFHPSEKNKSLIEIERILRFLNTNNCTRNAKIISIGGGITGDISSFAASIFMRGISYINIPTTLLAMTDSSIGGKTGVNFNQLKNLIGTFHQPEAVYIFTDFLKTLPEDEYESGLGEIIKYAFIAGNFSNGRQHQPKNIKQLISACVKIKAAVVQKDEFEQSGIRKILNFGHTFAHGIETSSNFRIKHGKAVIFGIIASLFYSYRVKLISAEFLYQSLLFISSFNILHITELRGINPKKVFEAMKADKKVSDGRIKLVLINQNNEFILDYPSRKDIIVDSIDDMKVWVKESFKKETVEK